MFIAAREIMRRIDAGGARVKAGLHIVWIQLYGNPRAYPPRVLRLARRARPEQLWP